MTTSTREPARSARRSALACAAGGVAVALTLAGCGSQVAGTASDGLARLRIGSSTGLAAGADSAAGVKGGPSGYALDGSLPAGPATGPVQRFRTAPTGADVTALAAALGLTAAPTAHEHGWVVSGSAGELRVRDDAAGQWSFARTSRCPSYYVDVDNADGNVGVGCAVADTPQASDTPLVTDDAALAAARPVLAAVGVEAEPGVRAGSSTSSRAVVADPVVADLPTSGLRTVIDVDPSGVLGATGWLGGLGADGDYPVLSAQDTFDRLASMPRPMYAMACPEIAPSPGATASDLPMQCGGGTTTITGARFGLTLSWESSTPILVPAWLFTVKGSDDPLAVVAVQDQYLADPTAPPTADPGTSAGSEPGSSGSAVPPQPAPAPSTTDTPVAPPTTVFPSEPQTGAAGGGGGTDPSTGSGGGSASSETPAVEKAFLDRDGTTLALEGWGGVCSEYSGIADESASTVKVRIIGRSTVGPDQACAAMAVQVKVVVTLSAPLGTRKVVDAASGLEVPVTRT